MSALSKRVLKSVSVAFLILLLCGRSWAQTDSSKMLPVRADSIPKKLQADTAGRKVVVDSLPLVATPLQNKSRVDSIMKYHSPRKAAIRSALVPGLGQIYNKKYWKVPIVWGALGVTGAIFAYNLTTYRELRDAVQIRTAAQPPGYDSTNWDKINPLYLNIDMNALRSYRDEYRRNIDYTALIFIVLWGLNVVDATVDAHLKAFDVSPDLSLKIKPGKSNMAGTTGISLILAIK
jgi:hypothetical protein